MGKGLNLNKDGSYVAFVAGTGILVFVDLIAMILRFNLGIETNAPNFIKNNSNFKLILYASFSSREEAIGLELIEGLNAIT